MAETKTFNTTLSVWTNSYVDLMKEDLETRGMEFDSYSKECVVSAMAAIYQMIHESGTDMKSVNTSNLKSVMQKVAALKLKCTAKRMLFPDQKRKRSRKRKTGTVGEENRICD